MKRYLTIEIEAGQEFCNDDEMCHYVMSMRGNNMCGLFLPMIQIGAEVAYLPCTPLEMAGEKIKRCQACLEAEEKWTSSS